MNTEIKWNLTARIGYYSEFCTATFLANILVKNNLTIKNSLTSIQKIKENYRNNIINNLNKFSRTTETKLISEIKRAENGGELLAQRIYKDLSLEHNNMNSFEFEIVHTGTSLMGIAKQDIELIVTEQGNVIDIIKASLKLYKKGNVNFANKTATSFINGILFPNIVELRGLRFLEMFMKKYPQYTDLILEMSGFSQLWKQIKKEKGRPIANKTINQQRGFHFIRDGLIYLFSEIYKNDKDNINARMVSTLGLDGKGDIYIVVGEKKSKMKVLSSRNSEKFKKVLDILRGKFTITYELSKNPKTVKPTMNIIDDTTNEKILSIDLLFKEGETFAHFLNIKQLL